LSGPGRAESSVGRAEVNEHERTVRRFFAETVSSRLPLDEPAAERAAELRAAHEALKMPDALILATGDLNADVVLTGDEQWLKASGLSCELRYVGSGA
jgi:hypothetical protein